MESSNLSFRQINLTALSHTRDFKARYKAHYQMRQRKEEEEKSVDTATMTHARDYVYKAHLQTEQVQGNEKHIFISSEVQLSGI